ncbi:hypothetical protein [Methylobacterium sp. ID0610]|uniref:hypothetical protein n=1 Tax=Methylobacterium carpenticola TaxID=3344827 RepID=UPI003681F645
MAHGGRRAGAGRKKGSVTRRTQEIVAKASAEGISPLEVMLTAMRRHVGANRWDDAAALAKDAAPYMHPRLQAVAHTGPNNGPILTADLTKASDEQLDALEALLGPLAGAAGGDAEDGEGGEGPAGG